MTTILNGLLQIAFTNLIAGTNQFAFHRRALAFTAQKLHPFFRQFNFVFNQSFVFRKFSFVSNQNGTDQSVFVHDAFFVVTSTEVGKHNLLVIPVIFREINIANAAQMQVFKLQDVHQHRTIVTTADVAVEVIGQHIGLLFGGSGNPVQRSFKFSDFAHGKNMRIAGLQVIVDHHTFATADGRIFGQIDIRNGADRVYNGCTLDGTPTFEVDHHPRTSTSLGDLTSVAERSRGARGEVTERRLPSGVKASRGDRMYLIVKINLNIPFHHIFGQ